MNVRFRKNFIKLLSLVNILGLFVQINYGMESKEHIDRHDSFHYCKSEIRNEISSLPSIERNIKIQAADGTSPQAGVPEKQVANAPLVSSSHAAGAMEGDRQREAPPGLSSRNNYERILQEIEELTSRIHAEVDKVLADYRRDTGEYHRRMGTRGKEWLATMALETREQEIDREQIEQRTTKTEKIKEKIPRQEEQRKVEEALLEEQLRAEARSQAGQHKAEAEETKEEMQRQEQKRKAEEAPMLRQLDEDVQGHAEQRRTKTEKIKEKIPRQEEQRKVEEALLEEQFGAEAQSQAGQHKAEAEETKEEMQRQEVQHKAEETLKPKGQLKAEAQNQVEQRRIDVEKIKAQMQRQGDQRKVEEALKTEGRCRRRENQRGDTKARRATQS